MMCVSYCRLKQQFYWNHYRCEAAVCDLAQCSHLPCATCRHRGSDNLCRLTHASLPAGEEGCCHHNAPLVADGALIEASRHTLGVLGIEPDETEEFVLIREDIPFQRDDSGRLWVSPDDLALPAVFGQGTEDLPEEDIDWTDWFAQWD